LGAAVLVQQAAQAQSAEPGSLAVENNAKSGAVAARSPGRMVSAALGRASEAQDRLLSRPEITEDGSVEQLSPLGQARIEALQTMFQSLNFLIVSLENVMLVQAGRDPVDIPIIDFPESGGDGGGVDLPDGVDLGDLLDGLLGN